MTGWERKLSWATRELGGCTSACPGLWASGAAASKPKRQGDQLGAGCAPPAPSPGTSAKNSSRPCFHEASQSFPLCMFELRHYGWLGRKAQNQGLTWLLPPLRETKATGSSAGGPGFQSKSAGAAREAGASGSLPPGPVASAKTSAGRFLPAGR